MTHYGLSVSSAIFSTYNFDENCEASLQNSMREPVKNYLKRVFSVKGGRGNSGSIILTATAAMAGGTQLFEGAHLTGGNTLLS